ncbi:metabotropic glutamate receptor 2 [Elysia marginata]|uniref:Metabotropic glutamate receptor 2 n=1 Tax=Elysia marginata TaxID=1093978 RepID=A0AAV4J0P6_9GAST|nr:metabotropic glutamate receptor 2 [Elysia marginata]
MRANAPSNKFFIVGGLFDVHNKGDTAYTCSSAMSMEGILSVQAFMWGINRYAQQQLAQTGVSVGVMAFDNCMRPEQSIENMLSYAQCKMQIQGLPHTNLVGYVGAYSNEEAKMLGPLATDLNIPLLSPLANSPELSDAENAFLLKLSPSLDNTVEVIYALLQKLEVDKVALLYDSEDPLWTKAYNVLSHHVNMDTKCIHFESAVMNDMFVTGLSERRDITYVVPLMSRAKLDHVMDVIYKNDTFKGMDFRFILSGIGQDRTFMQRTSAMANNALIVEPSFSEGTVQADLEAFLQDLSTSSDGQFGSSSISWITDYYRKNGKPVIDDSTPSKVKFMLDKTLSAVRGVINAMAKVIKTCNNQFCDQYRNEANKGFDLRKIFVRELFNGQDVNSLPNNQIKYNVYRYYVENAQSMFALAARYGVNGQGALELTLQQNFNQDDYREPGCPGIGSCCEDVTTISPDSTTGTTASTTTPRVNINNTVIVRYPEGQEITGAYFDANRPDSEYGTRFDLNHRWIIALGVLAGLGILSVIVFEIYILYKLLGTRMGNKWRTMWLGQLLLFGVLLCYLVLFAYLPIPTKATCGITRFGVGVSYSICFAVLLVKLMVILTSRTSSDVLLPGDAESPNYLKGIYQFLMFIFAVGVQVVIDIQWLITVPPEAVPVTSNNGDTVWVCNHYTWEAGKDMKSMDGWVRSNFENHLMSLTYIMVMILITTILSLNAHGIITNHRESVFIGIAAGFSIPIWLAWGLVGGLNQDHDYAQEFGDACIAFGLFCTATLILFSMFLPKVRQLVNMGVEGIYLEDDRETYYAGSVIMAPPSFKGKGPNSVIYVNNQGIYSEPVVIGNGDPMANRLRHPGSTYSAPPVFAKKADSTYGGSRVLRVTDDLKGRHPQKPRTQSEAGFGSRGSSRHGTLTRSRSQTSLGAL